LNSKIGGSLRRFQGTATINFASTATLALSAGVAITGLTGVKAGDHVVYVRVKGVRHTQTASLKVNVMRTDR